MKAPLFIVNFKTYKNGTGAEAVKMAKKLEAVVKRSKANVMFSVQNADLYRVSKAVKIPLLAQHADPVGYGAFTGKDIVECLKENGASGIMINHYEDRINLISIDRIIKKTKECKMTSVVCVDGPRLAMLVTRMRSDYISIEPPDLIGTGIAVSRVRPEILVEALSLIRDIPVLCGAGISTENDVKKALEIGCRGVIISSAIMKSDRPGAKLNEFLKI